MSENPFDIIIIGGGPGGYVAAIRASQLGYKTAVVEREHMGGVCLNWGCIPTKALLRSADVYELMHRSSEFGVKVDGISFDIEAVVKRSRKVARRLSSGVSGLMKKNKITIIEGEAKLEGTKNAPIVTVLTQGDKKTSYTCDHIIIATGARARTIPVAGLEPDGKNIWTAKEAMMPTAMPKSVLIIGSGAIGMEFASFYRAFGAKVDVVEMLDRILPAEDAEISKLAHKAFQKRGISIHTGVQVNTLKTSSSGVQAHLQAKSGEITYTNVEKVILAIGITGNIEGLGLEDLGVKTDRGHIVVDVLGRTDVPGVYAIGDVTGAPWLAHKASHEGVICVEAIAGRSPHSIDKTNIPGCTYCHPQVASVGLTEEKAKAAGFTVKVGRFPFAANGKAIALGDDQGLIKTIFDIKTGELLGAHMIGAEVTELIQGYVIGKTMETTEEDLMHTIFPHPTLSEMMHESVLDAYDQVVHY